MIIGLLVAILILVILSFWVNHSHTQYLYHNVKRDKEVYRARQNQIVQQVKTLETKFVEVTHLVVDCQEALDEKVDKLSIITTEQNESSAKLQTLVEFDIRTARQNELNRMKEVKIVLERIISITTSSRQAVATSDMLTLESVNSRIQELESILNESQVI